MTCLLKISFNEEDDDFFFLEEVWKFKVLLFHQEIMLEASFSDKVDNLQ